MNLTILSVAYPLAPVGPDAVGGAEQVLAQVERAAVEAGHRSIVIAVEGSQVAGKLIPIGCQPDPYDLVAVHEDVRQAIDGVLATEEVDVMHFHGIDCDEYFPANGPPAIVTLHLPPEWYPKSIWTHPNTHLHCVSESQQRTCPETAELWPPIPNGVDLGSFRPRWRKCGFALMLGRICPEKGFHIGIDAASRARMPAMIGGEVFGYDAHREYFVDQIVPRLPDTPHRWLGPLNLGRKRRLLRAASCLLIPSLAPETSSLVAMEALACGTPVIAFRSGALAEIVENGRTGFVVGNGCEMADAIGEIGQIDPRECRKAAEERFSLEKTIPAYIGAYQRAFEQDWRDLYDRCPYATPFASPEWMSGLPGELVTARRGSELIAAAGIGEMSISDYRDVLAVDAEAAQRLWSKLPPCVLDEIPPDSPFLAWADEPSEDASWCPFVRLDNLNLPSKLQKNLRLQRRKLPGSFEVASPSQTTEYLDALFELHESRWEGNGLLNAEQIQAFHRRVVPGFAKRGWLRFHGIRIDGRLRAVLYAFAKGGRVYYYLSGFDPTLAEFGPGSLLIYEAMQYAIAQGDREFDFLRGVEPYKYRWGAENRINKRLRKV